MKVHCYACLVVRPLHADHCQRCQSCVYFRHKHSRLFDRCIGEENHLAYFYFLLCNTLIFFGYVIAVFVAQDIKTSSWILFPLEGVYNLYSSGSFLQLVLLAMASVAAFEFLERLLMLGIAVASQVTVSELNDIWQHKYLLYSETSHMYNNKAPFFMYHAYSTGDMLTNLVKFLLMMKVEGRNVSINESINESESGRHGHGTKA